ncbi:Rieske (2Fe-2S) protein [Cupriavidus basilensis]
MTDIPDGRCRLLGLARMKSRCSMSMDRSTHWPTVAPTRSASLAGGKVDGTTVQCRAHGLRFNLATGHMAGNAALAVKCYPVTVSGGMVTVAASDD